MFLEAMLANKKVEDKLIAQRQSSPPMNICGFELFAVITTKNPAKNESYTAFVKHGLAYDAPSPPQ
jgi:hypothetical protein